MPTTSHRKLFVLDTNVLLHDPAALFRFEDPAEVAFETGRLRVRQVVGDHVDHLQSRVERGTDVGLTPPEYKVTAVQLEGAGRPAAARRG